MRNKLDEIVFFINSFKVQIHAIIISETRIYKEENNLFDIQGFTAYHSNRAKQKNKNKILNKGHFGRGGGVSVYVRKNVCSTFVFEEYIDDTNSNYVVVKLVQLNMHLIGIYRPPVKEYERKFIHKLEEYLSLYKHCIFIGDFNLDLFHRIDDVIMLYKETILSMGYIILNKIEANYATRVAQNSFTIIDHAFTDDFNYDFNILIDDVSLSDHRFMLLSVGKKVNNSNKNRIFSKSVINYEKLNMHPIWNELENLSSFDELIQKVLVAINDNREEVEYKSKEGNQPWVNKNLLNMIKNRNKFYRYMKKHKNDAYVKEKFNEYKNLARKTNIDLKRNWFKQNLNSCVSDPRKFWMYLKLAVFNKKNDPTEIIIEKNNVLTTDNYVIANEFNQHFINTAKNVVSKISSQTSQSIMYFNNLNYNIKTAFNIEQISEHDTVAAIRSLNINAACGIYPISTRFIVKYIDKLAPVLTKLINDCIANNDFPDVLKTAKVIPIFKSGESTNIDNYRGISVLLVFAKIFEIIIFKVLSEYFISNSVISPFQFGFTTKSNTTAACVELTNFISTYLDKKKFVSCIFIDLSKAFDTVDRWLLLNKLKKAGISGGNLNLFERYLSNRNQSVFVNNTYSDFDISEFGVPQGSNLGPLFFIFFINDIVHLKLFGELQMFADDIAIKYACTDIKTLFYQMQNDLNLLEQWFNNNKLMINIKKTKYMLFRVFNLNLIDDQSLTYMGQNLEKINEYKYLGLIIKDDFKWNKHVDYIKQKINPYIFSIKKLKNILPRKSLELIYYSYVYSHIIYLNPIWSGCTKYKLDQLYVLQKRALKYVTNVHWRHPTENLFQNDFKSLPYLIDHELLVLMYKIINNLIKHNFDLKQIKSFHDHNTRRKTNFNINFFSSEMCEHNVLYKGLNVYNNLPTDIKSAKTIENFKKCLKNHLPKIH